MLKRFLALSIIMVWTVGLYAQSEPERIYSIFYMKAKNGKEDQLEKGILEKIEETSVNGSTIHRLPHLSNISFRHLEGEALLIALDFHGVAVSTGSACSSGVVEPSHVLIAIGTPPSLRNSAIRFSLSRMNTKEDISCLLQILPPIVERIRKASPLYQTS